MILLIPSGSALGQLAGGVGGPGGVGGVRGLSSARSGLGMRNNPIANPAPGLTPHEVFHPRGSLSTGQILNPAPSLRRPRSGGTAPTLYQPGSTARSTYVAGQPSYNVGTGSPPTISSPVGQQLQQSASTLERQLMQLAPDKGWDKYLSVEALGKVQSSNDHPSDTERRELQSLLKRYESIAADEKYNKISSLPGFQWTVRTLQAYLEPMDERRRQVLKRYFDQLDAQLRPYTNGASWAKYLALPEELLSDETTEGASRQTRKLLKRFDKLNSDATYAEVTALPAFRPAYEALKLAVDPTDASPPPAGTTREKPSAAAVRQAVATDDRPNVGDSTEVPSTDPEPTRLPVGERILESVVELDRQLAKVAPDSEWPKRLSLDELRAVVSVSGDRPGSDTERKSLEDILGAYQAVAKNNEDAVVNKLPEFKETLAALQEYLKPSDAQPAE